MTKSSSVKTLTNRLNDAWNKHYCRKTTLENGRFGGYFDQDFFADGIMDDQEFLDDITQAFLDFEPKKPKGKKRGV